MQTRLLRGFLTVVPAAVVALTLPAAAHAQAQMSGTRFGVEAAYADHFNLGVGAFVKFHLTEMSGHAITGRASFDYFFPSDDEFCDDFTGCDVSEHYWQASFDALYDIANPKSNMKPYVGAGLGLSHFSVSCGEFDCGGGGTGGLGLNILAGLNFAANTKLMPFVEVKLGIAGGVADFGGSEFVIRGGIHL